MKYALLHALACSLVVLSPLSAADRSLLRTAQRPDTLTVDHPAGYVAIDLDVYAEALRQPVGGALSFTVALPELGIVSLDVRRFRVIDADARLIAHTANGPEPINKPESVLLHGEVRGMAGSHVMLACHPTYALGYIDIRSGTSVRRFLIAPTATPDRPVTLIIYDERYAEHPAPWNCHVTDESIPKLDKGRGGKDAETPQAGTLRRIEMAIEGDYTYYQDHGNDAVRATEYAEDVVAACSDIYERDVDALLYIKQWELWTVNDPYPGTASNTLLTQFRDYWRANKVPVVRSIAHLFSGVNGIGGIAYLTVLCNKNNGYAVDGLNNNIVYPRTTYAWDTDVVSHELGHNVGSPHTHSCSWAPPIDSCYTAEGGCFAGTKAVRGTIMSYCHLTPQGTNLEFHPRVQTLMEQRLAEASACVPLVTNMTVNVGRDTTICPTIETGLRATVTGGTAPYTYTWTPTTAIANATTATPTVSPMTSTTYVCEVRDVYGAVKRDTINVRVQSQLALLHVSDITICEGDAVPLQPLRTSCGAGTITYAWSPSAGLSSTNTLNTVATPSVTTTYQCTAVHQCGDTVRLNVMVRVNERPRVTLPPNMRICKGDVVSIPAQIIRGTPMYLLAWSFNGKVDPEAATPVIDLRPDSTMTIVLTATDVRGCVGADTMTIVVDPSPIATLPSIAQICSGERITVGATVRDGVRPYSYRWFLGTQELPETDSAIAVAPFSTSTVQCIVADANGCADTVERVVQVRSLDVAFLPNRLSVPALEACQDEMVQTIELRNDNVDTVRIVDLRASRVVPSASLPITIPPGASIAVTLRIRIPFTGDARDTIGFIDERCGRVYALSLSGIRGGLRSTASLGVDLGVAAACSTFIERRATAAIRNSGSTDVTLTSFVASPTLDVSVTASLPVNIGAGATVDVPIVVRGIFPNTEVHDSIMAVFRTSTCEGQASIPIRCLIAPYDLGVPESMDFGLAEGSQQVSRTITFTPTFEGLPMVTVTRVTVTGPFTTDLAVGTPLRSGRPQNVNVTFNSATVTVQGAQSGSLSIDVDGCTNAAEIRLSASTPVGIDETTDATYVVYDAFAGAIIVRDPEAVDVRVVDVLGRTTSAQLHEGVAVIPMRTATVVYVVVRTATRETVTPLIVR